MQRCFQLPWIELSQFIQSHFHHLGRAFVIIRELSYLIRVNSRRYSTSKTACLLCFSRMDFVRKGADTVPTVMSFCQLTALSRPHLRDSGIRKIFCLRNSESWALESGIQLKESGIPLTIGIQNPNCTEK